MEKPRRLSLWDAVVDEQRGDDGSSWIDIFVQSGSIQAVTRVRGDTNSNHIGHEQRITIERSNNRGLKIN